MLAMDVQKTQGWAFWTVTLWQDEQAMRQYMGSGAHKQAMPKLVDWCNEAASVHWVQDDATLPTWEQAKLKLKTSGRLFKVKHPSAAYKTGEINVS